MLAVDEVMGLLVAESLGTFGATSGWGIFIGTEPEELSTTITIIPTGGPAPAYTLTPGDDVLENPSFQIRVRGNDYQSAAEKLADVVGYLEKGGPFTVDDSSHAEQSVVWRRFRKTAEPMFLEKDSHGKYIHVASIQGVRKVTTVV